MKSPASVITAGKLHLWANFCLSCQMPALSVLPTLRSSPAPPLCLLISSPVFNCLAWPSHTASHFQRDHNKEACGGVSGQEQRWRTQLEGSLQKPPQRWRRHGRAGQWEQKVEAEQARPRGTGPRGPGRGRGVSARMPAVAPGRGRGTCTEVGEPDGRCPCGCHTSTHGLAGAWGCRCRHQSEHPAAMQVGGSKIMTLNFIRVEEV